MQILLFLTIFVPISLMPGLNMLLAFSFSMNFGYKMTFLVILGQLLGFTLVASACIHFLNFLTNHSEIFMILKIIASIFLLYLGVKMWLSKAECKEVKTKKQTKLKLFFQGFFVAFTNPKAWIFFLAFLPPFISMGFEILLLTMILVECVSLNIYALGGSVFKLFLTKYLGLINKFCALCLFAMAVFMIFDL